MTNTVLMDLAVGLASGAVKVVDLSVTLSADTPILELPEEFGWGKSWPFSKEEISLSFSLLLFKIFFFATYLKISMRYIILKHICVFKYYK